MRVGQEIIVLRQNIVFGSFNKKYYTEVVSLEVQWKWCGQAKGQ